MKFPSSKVFPAVMIAIMTFIDFPSAVEGLQCKFRLHSYIYDLCPLIFKIESLASLDSDSVSRHIHIHNDITTPSGVVHRSYDMDLGGDGLTTNKSLSVTDQCPLGTWICLTVTETFLPPLSATPTLRKIQIVPVAGNIKYINTNNETIASRVDASARLLFQPNSNEVLPLIELILNGGFYNFRKQRAKFTLRCDKAVGEPSNPVSALIQHDPSEPEPATESSPPTTHVFTWSTKHACPIAQDATRTSIAAHPAATPASPSSGPDASDSKDDETIPETPLKDIDLVPPTYRVNSTLIIAGSLVAISLVIYGLISIYIRRRKRTYASFAWGRTHYILPSLPLSIRLPDFIRGLLPRNFFTNYDPLMAEEYEIQDQDWQVENADGEVVDFQRQALLGTQRQGYGTVR